MQSFAQVAFPHVVAAYYVVALTSACSEGATGSSNSSEHGPTAGGTTTADSSTATTTAAPSTAAASVGTIGTTGVGGTTSGNGSTNATTGLGFGGSATSSGGVGGNSSTSDTTQAGGATGSIGGAGGATSSAGGVGGTGGTLSVAESIHEFRLESPCIDADHFGSDQPENCDVTAEVDRQTYTETLAGDSDVIYDVTLRVRGVAEPNTYASGSLEAPRFYVGGATTQPGYTAYSLTVTEPAEVYFFNYNDSVGHFLLELDYEVVIPMRGGTTVTFDINGQTSVPDGHGVSNRDGLVVADVPPAPDAFNGQFIQFDVSDVTPQQ
jgi:hypothetical protein